MPNREFESSLQPSAKLFLSVKRTLPISGYPVSHLSHWADAEADPSASYIEIGKGQTVEVFTYYYQSFMKWIPEKRTRLESSTQLFSLKSTRVLTWVFTFLVA